ncbi:unnamed protein product [Oikopleura dioica]|uniref:Phospholipase A2 domain-containing protein n=1 Tax=Oikopleura dioica TaxID=34765 RepID=E4YZA4_OIKDI|nr:unnamed protein product [Oikopleura dioica]
MKFSTAFFTTISANTIFTNAAPRSVHPGASNLFNILTFKANAAGFGDIDVEDLLKYGCHCNIYDGLEKGIGKPVDSVDSACKRYYECITCTEMKTSSASEPCVWSDTTYEVGSDENGLACPEEINSGLDSTGCSLDICKCNMQFADDIVAQLESYSEDNTHSNGFDKEAMCEASGQGLGGDLKCCGQNPFYNLYRDGNGIRECCKGRVLNTMTNECCDGNVSPIGTCSNGGGGNDGGNNSGNNGGNGGNSGY